MDGSTIPPRSSSSLSSRAVPPRVSNAAPPLHYDPLAAAGQRVRRAEYDDHQRGSLESERRQNGDGASVPSARLRTGWPFTANQSTGETWRDFLRESNDDLLSRTRSEDSRTLDNMASTHNSHTSSSDKTDKIRRSNSEGSRVLSDMARAHGLEATSSSSGRKRVTSGAAEDNNGKRRSHGSISSASIATRGSATNPIVLSSPPEARVNRPTGIERTASRGSIMIPPWQPDHEVSQCTVCGTPFTLFWRKHHCRKCGRVVCANCSPHRITIPRQFIVQPPPSPMVAPFWIFGTGTNGESQPPSGQSSTDTLRLIRTSSSSMFGGEIVRVCNPCVPDPNFSPPPQLPASQAYTGFPNPSNLYSGPFMGPGAGATPTMVNHPQGATTAQRATQPLPPPPFLRLPPGVVPTPPPSNTSAAAFAQRDRHASHPQTLPPIPQARPPGYTSYSTIPTPHPHNRSTSTSSAAPPSYNRNAPLPPLPRPSLPQHIPAPRRVRQIREEDECPVCGRELPPKAGNSDEAAREQHIDECIRQYSASSSSAPAPAAVRRQQPSSTAALAATAGPSFAALRRDWGMPDDRQPTEVSVPAALSHPEQTILPPQRPHQHRMLLYHATEKDCVGEDGDRQECVICFEEFEEGDDMGRLDCLCKFHRACIRQWWATKGVGSCPTHQLHQ